MLTHKIGILRSQFAISSFRNADLRLVTHEADSFAGAWRPIRHSLVLIENDSKVLVVSG
jgi:hypothetical protein